MLKITIKGYNLPGERFEDPHKGDVKEPVYVGIQKGKETIDLKSAGLDEVEFECELKPSETKDGRLHFLGPYVHGKAGDRFLYLGWFIGNEDIAGKRFRRTKIKLNHLSRNDIDTAIKKSKPLIVEIDLTGDDGGPLCGSMTEGNMLWKNC
ncbi:DUF5990 family protein [Cerasicoccus maritimus]|uniref:DUF5990 family protein n=1 Tax=Cerasicoccus maritimus TaxID=490089 RepID=UPI002852564E|nr:DUF5990 family protein [Cerasicoccus maritimus]